MSVGAERPNTQTIVEWLIERVAALVGVAPNELDTAQPFAVFGLDSIAAVGLSGELEDWLGVELPATILWDYPTIAALAEHLAQ
jgi:8-amino-7-oxononanoate synthase